MATDFFERQDAARRNTTRLVILFALAVLALIVSIDLLLAATMGYLGRNPETGAIDWALAADPRVLSLAVFGTLIVAGGGSLFKIAQLRGGGQVVAEQLGGRLINPDSAVPSEQQLLNVVQEMAIASGAPTPPVYLLDNEAGINAFAAGFTPSDAVIGVTRGAADTFTRDELQGVIAHEFSHILNGDMRLNIRLIGLLHGILIIGILGYFVLRMAAFSGVGRSRSRQESSPLPMLALGAGLMAVGLFGTLFGNLIKAAVSRQREFPRRRVGRTVHATPSGNRECAEADRRCDDRLGHPEPERAGGEPPVLRPGHEGVQRTLFDASATGRADSPDRAILGRRAA